MTEVTVRNAGEGAVVVAGTLLFPGETARVDEAVAQALIAERGNDVLAVVGAPTVESGEPPKKEKEKGKGGKPKQDSEPAGGQGDQTPPGDPTIENK